MLQVGDEAPDFALVSAHGETVRLSDFRGRSPVALVFVPFAFTGTCTGELCELRDNPALFQQHGVELLVVTVDSKASLRAWGERESFAFTLLSDFWPHGAVAQRYGCFSEERGTATRATFVIDSRGRVAARFSSEFGEPRPLAEYRKALARLSEG